MLEIFTYLTSFSDFESSSLCVCVCETTLVRVCVRACICEEIRGFYGQVKAPFHLIRESQGDLQ